VHPSVSERRFVQRRVLDNDRTRAPDQRSGLDRRGGRGKNARAPVAAEFAYGWLCFETVDEKRRLAPVPADWGRADDETIEQWCCVAKPALRRKTGEILGSGGGRETPVGGLDLEPDLRLRSGAVELSDNGRII
jgi:hypothetical protein